MKKFYYDKRVNKSLPNMTIYYEKRKKFDQRTAESYTYNFFTKGRNSYKFIGRLTINENKIRRCFAFLFKALEYENI